MVKKSIEDVWKEGVYIFLETLEDCSFMDRLIFGLNMIFRPRFVKDKYDVTVFTSFRNWSHKKK